MARGRLFLREARAQSSKAATRKRVRHQLLPRLSELRRLAVQLSLAAAKGELQQSLAEREDMLRRAAMEAEAAAAKGASMTEEERMALLLDSM